MKVERASTGGLSRDRMPQLADIQFVYPSSLST